MTEVDGFPERLGTPIGDPVKVVEIRRTDWQLTLCFEGGGEYWFSLAPFYKDKRNDDLLAANLALVTDYRHLRDEIAALRTLIADSDLIAAAPALFAACEAVKEWSLHNLEADEAEYYYRMHELIDAALTKATGEE